MKKLSLLLFASCLAVSLTAQVKVTARPIKKVATLSMPGETGANGASVVWHPVLKKYYASFAGNSTFPFAVFSPTYTLLSDETLEAMHDVRGLWYNTVSKKIEANGYSDFGWVSYKLDAKGIPQEVESLVEGQAQPEEQSVGAFDAVKKKVCFFVGNRIVYYTLKGEAEDIAIELQLGGAPVPAEGELVDESDPSEYYNGAMSYTGIANAEFALLNTDNLKIELYNRKGVLTKAFQLPDDVKVYTNFNFAYANGTWWLFDKDEREWYGYK